MPRNIFFTSIVALCWGLHKLSVDGSQLCDQTVFRCPYEQTCFDYYRKSECTGRTNRHHSDILSCKDAKLHKICLDVKTVCAAASQDAHLTGGMHRTDFRTGSSGLCLRKHTNDGNSCYDHSQCPAVSGGVALCCHQRCVHVHNVPGVRDFFKEEDRLCTDHGLQQLDSYHRNGHSSGKHSNNNSNNDEFYHTLIQSLGRTKNAMRKIEIATNGVSNPGTNLALVRQTSAINVRLVQFASFIPDIPTGAACVSESSAIIETVNELIQRANDTTGCPSNLNTLPTDGNSAGSLSGEGYYRCLCQQEGQFLAEILTDGANSKITGSGYYLNMVRKFATEGAAVEKVISSNDESSACSKAIEELGRGIQAVMQSPDDGGSSGSVASGTSNNEGYKNIVQSFARSNNLMREVAIVTADTSSPGLFLNLVQQTSTISVRLVMVATLQADVPTGAECVSELSNILIDAADFSQYENDTAGCPNNLNLFPTDGTSGGGVAGETYYHCLIQQFGFYFGEILHLGRTTASTNSGGYYMNMMRKVYGYQNAVGQVVANNDVSSNCSVAFKNLGRGVQALFNSVDVTM